MHERRQELIEQALKCFLEHGVAGLSLRPMAARVGTSARLLIYHFGSKEGLITAVMDEARARMQESFAQLLADRGGAAEGLMLSFWAWVTHPNNIKCIRLLLEVQILALQDPVRYARYLKGTSSSWLKLIEASLPASGENRALATLCVAVIDGLLLEYLSTGDSQRTKQALDLFNRVIVDYRRGEHTSQ
jgi:AcrR family transcriptional regulator